MRRLAKGRRLPRLEGLTRRLKRSKRLIINRRGDGVHSPYAFHLISRVIRNRRPYYNHYGRKEKTHLRHKRRCAVARFLAISLSVGIYQKRMMTMQMPISQRRARFL